MKDGAGAEGDWLASYAVQLENAILIAAAALRSGDAEYARRVLEVMEARIRSNVVEAEARTVH